MNTRTWKDYAVIDSDGEIDRVFRGDHNEDLADARRWYEPSEGDTIVVRTVTRTETEWEDVK